jgi:hypothetical protein
VREDLEYAQEYIGSEIVTPQESAVKVVREMADSKGKILTIKYITDKGNYKVKEMGWTFTDGMFVGKVVPIENHEDLEIGDLVLIRTDLEVGESYDGEDAEVDEDMLQYQGKLAIITDNYEDGDFDINLDDEDNYWSTGMFVGKVVKPVEVEETPSEEDEVGFAELVEEFVAEVEREEVKVKDPSDIREIEDYKYKVGDKVRIKQGLTEGHYDAEKFNGGSTMYFNPSMAKYCGMEATVVEVNRYNGTYTLDTEKEGRTGYYVWSVGMLDSIVKESHTLNAMAQFGLHIERVIFSEPATILFYRVPDIDQFSGLVLSMSDTKKVVAKCIEGDTFDKDTGLNVALYKALIKEATKQLRKI